MKCVVAILVAVMLLSETESFLFKRKTKTETVTTSTTHSVTFTTTVTRSTRKQKRDADYNIEMPCDLEKYDEDKDLRLSVHEVIQVLKDYDSDFTESDVITVFKTFDENGDAFITEEELSKDEGYVECVVETALMEIQKSKNEEVPKVPASSA